MYTFNHHKCELNPAKNFLNNYFFDSDFFKYFRTSNILFENSDLFEYFVSVFNVITFEVDVRQHASNFDFNLQFVITNNRIDAVSDSYAFLRSLGVSYQTTLCGRPNINPNRLITLDGCNPFISVRDVENFKIFHNLSDIHTHFGIFDFEFPGEDWALYSFRGFVDYDNYGTYQLSVLLDNFFSKFDYFYDYFFLYFWVYISTYSDFAADHLLFYDAFDIFIILLFIIFLFLHSIFFYIFNFFINNSIIAPIFNVLFILVTNICLMLVVTLIIAALTLIERKFLSLTQRRVGPYYVGYRGRLQYIADALKLFLKGATVHNEANKF